MSKEKQMEKWNDRVETALREKDAKLAAIDRAIKKRKPVDMSAIEAASLKLEKMKAKQRSEIERAEKELQKLKEDLDMSQGAYINGIYKTPEELDRIVEIKQQSATEEPKPEKPPFTSNPYLCLFEKMELADAMRWNHINIKTKDFVDIRHQEIYSAYYALFYENYSQVAQRPRVEITPESLIDLLRKNGRLENAGGEDFVNDIFQGLHRQ